MREATLSNSNPSISASAGGTPAVPGGLMPESAETWALVLVGALLAGLVQGATGFAFSIVALSFWAWALPPEVAAPLAVLGALTGQLTSLFSVRRGFEWSRILPFVAGGVVGVPVGVFVLHNVD